MDLQLKGRRAFISGSTQGIGRAVARALAQEGAEVVVHGRDTDGVNDTVRGLAEDVPGAAISGIAADVSDPGEVGRLVTALGEVDILVNNVGIFGVGSFEDTTDEMWHRYLEVNLMSAVRLSRRVLPGMLTRDWG